MADAALQNLPTASKEAPETEKILSLTANLFEKKPVRRRFSFIYIY